MKPRERCTYRLFRSGQNLHSELETVSMLALSNLNSCRDAVPFRLGSVVTPRAEEMILMEKNRHTD